MISDAFEEIRQMSDRELYSFFQEDQFYDDPEYAKALCQELENREAAREGRAPAIIIFRELEPGVLGVAGTENGKKVITLNIAFLKKSVPQILTPGLAMNAIFHEGRHIWQFHVLETNAQQVPLSVRLLLGADNICYTNGTENVIDVGVSQEVQGSLEYLLQENEMDARFYALKRMSEVEAEVSMDDAFQIDLENMRQIEISLIRKTLEHFDERKYRLLEKKRLDMYKARAKEILRKTGARLPELPEKFRCYQNIWIIRNIIKPVYDWFIGMVERLRRDIIKAGNFLLNMYMIARMYAAEGRPLETPNELVNVVLHSEFCREFHLKQEAIPKEWAKPIGM